MKKKEVQILIVEDDPHFSKVITEAFKRKGYGVLLAANPDDALQIAKIKTIHMAIIDCMLPKKNGIELSKDLRALGLTDLPIILMSGIFKDRNFSSDAIKKTSAIDFFAKPFDLNQMVTLIEKNLESVVDIPKLPLHTLMSKPLASSRQRLRAIDKIEEINGLDLPFVISILLESHVDGHLNVVSESGAIFGISFSNGKVVKVDTDYSKDILEKLLLKGGFINQQGLDDFKKTDKKGDVLKNLISESIISPHAHSIIQTEQMISEIKDMVKDSNLHINFSAGSINEYVVDLGFNLLTPLFLEAIVEKSTLTWLVSFYQPWLKHPIKKGAAFESNHQVFSFPVIKENLRLVDLIFSSNSIADIIASKEYPEELIYKILHFFAILKVIVFDEEKVKGKATFKTSIKKIEKTYASLKDKNIFEVYKYFGASDKMDFGEIDKIYKDFAKVNHPDKFNSNDMTEEQKKIIHDLFSIMTNAHDILTHEEKKKAYLEKINQKQLEDQMNAEKLLFEGKALLMKNQFAQSLSVLKKAFELHSSQEIQLYLYWSELKNLKGELSTKVFNEISSFVDHYPPSDRKSADYNMLAGLFKYVAKDKSAAAKFFNKALELDSRFLPARRELTMLNAVSSESQSGVKKAENLLNQDVGKLISNLFKRKKVG